MIRVLQFTDIINKDDFIDAIIQRADQSKFQVGVCVRDSYSNIASPVYTECVKYWEFNGASRLGFPDAVFRLAQILRRWRVDILHAHHYDQAIIGWLATKFSSGTRLIIGRHYSNSIYRIDSVLKRKTLLSLEQIANHSSTRIIVPSTMIRTILAQQQIAEDKIDLIPYGFIPEKYSVPDTEMIRQIHRQYSENKSFLVGTFCRLHEEKGHKYLLQAAQILRQQGYDFKILLVGEGPERRSIEQLIQEFGLHAYVKLLGWRRDAMAIMAAVDVIVQPTLQEAFSQVMCEALWMNKPLVITKVSGATDIVEDGKNGLLVPCANAVALSTAIQRIMKDKELATSLANAGRRYVEEKLTIDRIIPYYEQSYVRAMHS